jgi:hypothetical protein
MTREAESERGRLPARAKMRTFGFHSKNKSFYCGYITSRWVFTFDYALQRVSDMGSFLGPFPWGRFRGYSVYFWSEWQHHSYYFCRFKAIVFSLFMLVYLTLFCLNRFTFNTFRMFRYAYDPNQGTSACSGYHLNLEGRCGSEMPFHFRSFKVIL